MKENEFEHQYCLALVEEILFLKDRNPKKDWGHIWGLSTIYSYSRWNKLVCRIPMPKKLLTIPLKFISPVIEIYEADFSQEQIFFLKKYPIFTLSDMTYIDPKDSYIYPRISKIINWYNNHYIRSALGEVGDDFLLNFLYGISRDKTHEHDYYFCFCESIDLFGITHLLHSGKLNPDFLFTNIAIASYFYQQKNISIAQKYYLQSLNIDPNNPWILGKYAMLLASQGDLNALKIAESLLQKVTILLPNSPWVYDWYGDILYRNGLYIQALEVFEKYEQITEGKYRTFEPYMKRAETYLALGDISSALTDLSREGEYYFGEGYRERLKEIQADVALFLKD